MRRHLIIAVTAISLMALGCAKLDKGDHDLKKMLDDNISQISQALVAISATDGYQLLSSSTSSLKSETEFNDSITLGMVAGVYDFAPDPWHRHNFFIPYRLFRKTGDSDKLVVNMPHKLAIRPLHLHSMNASDSLLNRNFRITANEYHYYYTWYYKHDYKLSADLSLSENPMGNLNVVSKRDRESGKSYTSTYTFEEGYKISVSFSSGDTTESSFSLIDDDKTLMKETILWIGEDFRKKERQYILSVGNIDIKRGTGIDSIQVYLDGVLQKTAGAKIVDSTGSDGSVCHHRDILLTFDDGTTVKLSELLDPSKDVLRSLVDSLRSMNFAKNVVDYIAISIYYHSNRL